MSGSQSAMTLRSGTEPVAGYRLRRHRGQGGFAEVWEAKRRDGQRVALKFISTAKLGRQRSTVKEIRSIQTIRRLKHPSIIPIYDVLSVPGWIVVAMELADGSLMDLLKAYRQECNTAMPPDVMMPYMVQVATALDFLNERHHYIDGKRVGIQHADIKPNNILAISDRAMLADFGLSTMLSGVQATNYVAGTMLYAAPEVFRGLINCRTDQYALAVTYCVLRTGKAPFDDVPKEFRTDWKRGRPVLDELTEQERPVLERALSPAPADRWPSCGELIGELERKLRNARPVPMKVSSNPGWEQQLVGGSF